MPPSKARCQQHHQAGPRQQQAPTGRLTQPQHAGQSRQQRHAELHAGGGTGLELRQHGVPDGVAQARGDATRQQRIQYPLEWPLGRAPAGQAEQQGHGHGAQEIAGAYRNRVGLLAPAQRIHAPGQAGRQHQQGPRQRRRRDARCQQHHQAGHRQQQAYALNAVQALATPPPVANHADLHRAKQQQRAGTRAQGAVGKGEGGGIDAQRQRRAGIAGDGAARAAPSHQQPEHQRAAEHAQAGKAGRVDAGVAQR